MGGLKTMTLALHGGNPVVSHGRAVRWPVIGAEEREAALGVIDSGVLCGANAPQIVALEREFAAFAGARFCLATNSGTAALHMALAAAGIEPGDEVLTTAFSYPATALAVLQHRAVPVFADIDPVDFNLDPSDAARRVPPRAILPVHLHGLPCDMDAITALARRHALVVIEDAAQAHGATYRSRRTGALGDLAAFSLNATKNLPCGEGGLLTTCDERCFERAAALRILGQTRADAPFDPARPLDCDAESEFAGLGWMYLTQEIPAAIARVQLRRLEGFNANAAANAACLTERLGALPGLVPPSCPKERTHVYHKYRVRLDRERLGVSIEPRRLRDLVMAALRAEGVEVRLWMDRPLPELAVFRSAGGAPDDYPNTRALLADSFVVGSQTFPLYPQPRALMMQYADAFEKVWDHLPDLIESGGR
jgi:dTDP-4-amino-4,6-dideoxygalactose transaminase